MNRRSVLLGLATAMSAGCLGAIPSEPGSPSPTPSPTPEPTLEFVVTDRSCGRGENSAAVRIGPEYVTVDGTIGGRDTCDTARIDSASWSDGTLTVRVSTTRIETTATVQCAQCVTDIDYTARVPIGDRTPEKVVVIHDSVTGTGTVTTASS